MLDGILTETGVSWPGTGRSISDGITARGHPIIEAGVPIVAIVSVIESLLVDLMSPAPAASSR